MTNSPPPMAVFGNSHHEHFTQKRHRVALYSHETMGLGHMRRNMLIARTLENSSLNPSILMVTGACTAGAFDMPRGVDFVTLPSLRKSVQGEYYSRGLNISLQELIALRRQVIQAAMISYVPDIFIVDKEARGALGELDPVLDVLRLQGRTRCVLGLRDILDDPETVRREWEDGDILQAIRDFYDEVWVYGDPTVFDPVREYNIPDDIAEMVHYVGYLDRRVPPVSGLSVATPAIMELLDSSCVALCMVGGGQDGEYLAETFAQSQFGPNTCGVLLTGPHMPKEVIDRICRMAASRRDLRVLDFTSQPELLLERADCVISMGGYNSVCEGLSYGKPLLIVPRVEPRTEQLIRAERMGALGLLDFIHPDDLKPQSLSEWIMRKKPPVPEVRQRLDFRGLERLAYLAEAAIAPPLETLTPSLVSDLN